MNSQMHRCSEVGVGMHGSITSNAKYSARLSRLTHPRRERSLGVVTGSKTLTQLVPERKYSASHHSSGSMRPSRRGVRPSYARRVRCGKAGLPTIRGTSLAADGTSGCGHVEHRRRAPPLLLCWLPAHNAAAAARAGVRSRTGQRSSIGSTVPAQRALHRVSPSWRGLLLQAPLSSSPQHAAFMLGMAAVSMAAPHGEGCLVGGPAGGLCARAFSASRAVSSSGAVVSRHQLRGIAATAPRAPRRHGASPVRVPSRYAAVALPAAPVIGQRFLILDSDFSHGHRSATKVFCSRALTA
jgi:hypothetical protein